MKGKTKTQKGITLVALIITIVVLLILAAVAISSITNDNILGYAQNAAKDYNQAVKNEQTTLDYLESYLAGWVQNGTTVSKITTNGRITLNVGDYVNYVSGVSGYTDENGWQVIGAENGQILIMSSKKIVSTHTLDGPNGYLNGVAELNSLCTDYGKGTYATGVRSVNVDDINRITGYNPTTANWNAGKVTQYGNEVTYSLTSDGKIAYSGTNEKTGTSTYTRFIMPDGTALTADNPITLTSDYYAYAASSYLTDTNSNAYKLIYGREESYYWLATSCIATGEGEASFGFFAVAEDYVDYGFIFDTSARTLED